MNVKTGDFAKVVPPHFRAGTFVTVLEACTAEEFAMLCAGEAEWLDAGHVWSCRLVTGSSGVMAATMANAYFLPGDEAWIADKYLRRIDPVFFGLDFAATEHSEPAPQPAVPA